MSLVVNTNSYLDRTTADTYFADSLNATAWTSSTDDTKEDALVSAARILERQLWVGTKTNPAQAMQWPRTGVTDPYGNAVNSATVPQFIKDAQCELALALLQNPSLLTAANASNNVKRLKADTAEIEFFRPVNGARFPTQINELIGFYLLSSSSLSAPEYSGGCEQSQISDYDLNRGY